MQVYWQLNPSASVQKPQVLQVYWRLNLSENLNEVRKTPVVCVKLHAGCDRCRKRQVYPTDVCDVGGPGSTYKHAALGAGPHSRVIANVDKRVN